MNKIPRVPKKYLWDMWGWWGPAPTSQCECCRADHDMPVRISEITATYGLDVDDVIWIAKNGCFEPEIHDDCLYDAGQPLYWHMKASFFYNS